MTEQAVVVGASGLVGRKLVAQLLEDQAVDQVVTLVRRPSGVIHRKLDEHIVDFEKPESWSALVRGAVLYSALGTTLKVAGSPEAQYRVDHDYQLFAARAARQNDATCLVLVSAAGSSETSRMFYPRMKGELERDVRELGFPRLRILRPGFLDGVRPEHRPLERLALPVVRLLPAWKGLAAVRPILDETVARAARRCAADPTPGARVYEAAKLFEWGAA